MPYCAREVLARKFRQNWLNKFSDIRYTNFFEKELDDSLTNLNWLPNISLNKLTFQTLPLSPPTEMGDSGFYEITCSLDQLDESSRHFYKTNTAGKPPFTFLSLICMAIQDLAQSRVTFTQICEWIISNFPYYQLVDISWQNSVRNLLAVSKCFQKVPRRKDEPEKGGFWRLSGDYQKYLNQAAVAASSGTSGSSSFNKSMSQSLLNSSSLNCSGGSHLLKQTVPCSLNPDVYPDYLCQQQQQGVATTSTVNSGHHLASLTSSTSSASMLLASDLLHMPYTHHPHHAHHSHHQHPHPHHLPPLPQTGFSIPYPTHQQQQPHQLQQPYQQHHNHHGSGISCYTSSGRKSHYNSSTNNSKSFTIASDSSKLNQTFPPPSQYHPSSTSEQHHYVSHLKRHRMRSSHNPLPAPSTVTVSSSNLNMLPQPMHHPQLSSASSSFTQYQHFASGLYPDFPVNKPLSNPNNTTSNRFCSPKHNFYMNPAAMSTPIGNIGSNPASHFPSHYSYMPLNNRTRNRLLFENERYYNNKHRLNSNIRQTTTAVSTTSCFNNPPSNSRSYTDSSSSTNNGRYGSFHQSSNSAFSSFRSLVHKRSTYQCSTTLSPILNSSNTIKPPQGYPSDNINHSNNNRSKSSNKVSSSTNNNFSPFPEDTMSQHRRPSRKPEATIGMSSLDSSRSAGSDQFLVNQDIVKEEFSLSSSPNFNSSFNNQESFTTQIKEEMKISTISWWNLNQSETCSIEDTIASCEKSEPLVSSPYLELDREQQWVDEELNLEELDSILGLS